MLNLIGSCVAYAAMIWLSLLMGDKILSKTELSENQWAKLSVGFFSFVAVFQLLIYPAQIFRWSTFSLMVCFLVECAGIIVLNRKRIFSVLKENLKAIVIVSVFGALAAFLFVFYGEDMRQITLADNWFYLKFIRENADLSSFVNLFNPLSGKDNGIQDIYAFSGLHHLYSVLSVLFRVDSVFFSMWSGTALMHAIATGCAGFLISWQGKSNRWAVLLFGVIFLEAFTGLNIEFGYLPTYYRSISGSTLLLILFLVRYFKDNEKLYLYLYLTFSVALMACQSTQFFLSVALTFVYCVAEILLHKNKNVHEFTFVAMPCILYALAMLLYGKSWWMSMLLVVAFGLLNAVYALIRKTKAYSYLVCFILFTLAVLINGAGFVLSEASIPLTESWSYFVSLYVYRGSLVSLGNWSSLLKVVIRWILLVGTVDMMLHFKIIKKEQRFLVIMIVALFVYFYNPLAAPLISTVLSGTVYHRFSYLCNSAALYVLLIQYFNEVIWKKLFSCVIAASFVISSLTAVLNEVSHVSDTMEMVVNTEVQTLLYKVNPELIDLALFLDQYTDQRVRILYSKYINCFILYSDHLISSTLMPSFSQMRYDDVLNYEDLSANVPHNQIQAILRAPEYYFTDYFYQFEPERVPDLKNILLESKTDLFVIAKWKGEESHVQYDQMLNSFCYKIHETEHYEVYRIYREN